MYNKFDGVENFVAFIESIKTLVKGNPPLTNIFKLQRVV